MDPASYDLHPLPIPVPPVLFEALGYPGEQRFFTMRWSEASEYHPVLLDYWDGFYGQSRPQDAYLLYTSHPRVAPLLADYELGADPDSATHLLVFDRTERVAWIGTVMDVHQFLKEQWPQMSQEEVNAIAFSVFDKLMTSALQDAELSFQERAEERRPQAEKAQQRRATLLSELQRALDEAAIPARPGPPKSSEQLAELQANLVKFEERYGMSSDEFYERFQSGRTDDRMDFVEWASLVQMRDNLARSPGS